MVFFFASTHIYAEKYEYNGYCTSKVHRDDFEECLDKERAMYDKELNELSLYGTIIIFQPHRIH